MGLFIVSLVKILRRIDNIRIEFYDIFRLYCVRYLTAVWLDVVAVPVFGFPRVVTRLNREDALQRLDFCRSSEPCHTRGVREILGIQAIGFEAVPKRNR